MLWPSAMACGNLDEVRVGRSIGSPLPSSWRHRQAESISSLRRRRERTTGEWFRKTSSPPQTASWRFNAPQALSRFEAKPQHSRSGHPARFDSANRFWKAQSPPRGLIRVNAQSVRIARPKLPHRLTRKFQIGSTTRFNALTALNIH